MIARRRCGVKIEECLLDLGGTAVEIFPAEGAGLLRELHHGYERTDVPGEPGLVHLQVVMGDAGPDPAPPAVVPSCRHPQCPLSVWPRMSSVAPARARNPLRFATARYETHVPVRPLPLRNLMPFCREVGARIRGFFAVVHVAARGCRGIRSSVIGLSEEGRNGCSRRQSGS